jgi:CO/xanthine dehydrogenase FAD-binding subunit
VRSGEGLDRARLVFGGLAPTPWRSKAAELSLAQSPTVKSLRSVLDRELDRAAHPLERNGWKLDAAAGLAEKALEALLNGGSAS